MCASKSGQCVVGRSPRSNPEPVQDRPSSSGAVLSIHFAKLVVPLNHALIVRQRDGRRTVTKNFNYDATAYTQIG